MEREGKIIQDLPEQGGVSKAGNNWRKKEWVLETGGQYPRIVKFDFFGDRVDNNKLEVGKRYVISFDLESREFNGRWYTDVRAYASRPADENIPVEPTPPVNQVDSTYDLRKGGGTNFDPLTVGEDESNDDLPF